jgi:two-component system alkaline phosphatase synthesis response regulator PhoP
MMNPKRKILLVDDDLDLLEQNKILIESMNYEVITANSSKEGWEVFKKSNPDACVIDLIMEEYDSGFVLCHRIKKDEKGKDIPIFILTSATYETGFKFGASTSEEKEWIAADEIINKPVIIDEFVQKLENYIQLKNK